MLLIFLEIHSLLLATNSLLIEKGLITKEELESKREKIFKLMRDYGLLMASQTEDKQKEDEKLKEIVQISRDLIKECNFEIGEMQEDYINKQFANRNQKVA